MEIAERNPHVGILPKSWSAIKKFCVETWQANNIKEAPDTGPSTLAQTGLLPEGDEYPPKK